MTCITCNRDETNGYKRYDRDRNLTEMCCDPCHGPFLPVGQSVSWFVKFHGRKAKKMMAYKPWPAAA